MTQTEVWFRNPHNYIKEMVEANYGWIAWDRGLVHKRNLNTVAHAELYFGKTIPYRILIIGQQGTAEVGPGNNLGNPIAVYPTWSYGDEQALLEELVSSPVGEDKEICFSFDVQKDELPVYGQEHRVVITNVPNAGSIGARKFYSWLSQLQEDYPKCIIHLHGSYSFRMMFGMGYRATDFDPRTSAGNGSIFLPNGRCIKSDQASKQAKWFSATGFLPVDMAVPRNRCIFNIKSTIWAGKNYAELNNFRLNAHSNVDSTSSDGEYVPKTVKFVKPSYAEEGDMMTCDNCSLADNCRYERTGAVCSVPGAEMTQLGKYFKTRDSATIMDGLSELMGQNARRLESGIREEDDMGELNPEVTKIMGQIFEQGVKLAKLVDPSLRGAKVAVNVLQSGGTTQIASNPKELLASAVRELELQGIKREDITPAMIEGMLSGMVNQNAANRAIEGVVISQDNS